MSEQLARVNMKTVVSARFQDLQATVSYDSHTTVVQRFRKCQRYNYVVKYCCNEEAC